MPCQLGAFRGVEGSRALRYRQLSLLQQLARLRSAKKPLLTRNRDPRLG